jgi:hypothetical protein
MKMIAKVSKKTFVKNVEHTKLQPNKQFTSIKPGARTRISPSDFPSNSRGSGPGLLKILRGIFTACKASKEVIIKSKKLLLGISISFTTSLKSPSLYRSLMRQKLSLLIPTGPSQLKSLLTFRWVRQEVPMLPMETTMIRMMVMSQMMGRKSSSFSQLQCIGYCLPFSFIRV